MKAEQNYYPPLSANAGRFGEGDEGGLDLGQVLATLRRRALSIATIASGVAALAILKAFNDPPIYKGQFEILIEPATAETQVISSTNPETLSNPEETIDVKDEAVLKILKSAEILNPIVKQLQPQFPEIEDEDLVNGLNISTIGESLQVVTVTYQHSDKELAESVLDKVSQAYLDYSRNTRQTGIRRGITFVEERLPELRSRVNALQAQLQKIRQQNNLVDPEMKGKELSTLLATFGQQQLETQIQLQEAKALYGSLQQQLTQQGAELAAAPTLSDNSRYQTLLNQLQEIDSQIAKDSVLLFEESREIKILKNQRQNLLPLIEQESQRVVREAANQIAELETRDRILSETIARLNLQVKQLSGILRQYTEVQRELEIATTNLNEFLSKREGLRIDAAQKEIPWSLLTPPEDPIPMSASLKKNAVLGAILGLLLGIGAALALDKFSNRLYTPKEIKEVVRFPILGAIPFEKDLAKLLDPQQRNGSSDRPFKLTNGHKKNGYGGSSFFEAFRSLYTNIRLIGVDAPTHSLVVSSATPEEGKSTIAIYLAQAAAALGQRVLLVDTDLRYPSLHERLKLSNSEGLADLFSPKSLDLNLAIQRSPLEDNLFVLTAGSTTLLDATRLLASQKMQDLMKQLQDAFDLVIYKAPPLIGLADTYLLAAQTDGILLVASLGQLKRSGLEQVVDELKLSNTQLLGIVTNCVKETQRPLLLK